MTDLLYASSIVLAIGGSVAVIYLMEWLDRKTHRKTHTKNQVTSRGELLRIVDEYVSGLETNLTAETCLCRWQTFRVYDKEQVQYRDMKRLADNHPYCPVHSKEGLLVHFVAQHFSNQFPGEDFKFDKLSLPTSETSDSRKG